MDIEKWNRFGLNSGGSEDWIWVARKIDLMNETQVYGTVVWSSSGIDVGPDNVQFPLFSLSPEFINSERSVYWLRSIASMHYFTVVSLFGDSSFRDDATDICGVRPYFYID